MFLAWKELTYYKGKYGLVTGVLVLLTFMVLFLSGLANGLGNATSATIRNRDATYYAIASDSDDIITRSELTDEQVATIGIVVMESTPFNLQRTAITKANDATKIDCTYLAVNPKSFMMVPVTEGTADLALNDIILDDSFMDEGIALGDVIKDATTGITLTVVGFTHGESYGHSAVGVMTSKTYQGIRAEATKSDRITFNAVAIKNGAALTFAEADVVMLSKEDIINKIPGHAQEQVTISMILIVLLVLSAAILGVFFYVITIQRIPQFGTLKAVGTPMKMIASMIVWQVLIIAGGSILIGDLLAFGMAAMMPNKMPFSLHVGQAVLISVSFVLISLISSLFTLIKVAKVDPIIAIGGIE